MLLTAWFQVGDVFNPCWLDPVRHFSEMGAPAFKLIGPIVLLVLDM